MRPCRVKARSTQRRLRPTIRALTSYRRTATIPGQLVTICGSQLTTIGLMRSSPSTWHPTHTPHQIHKNTHHPTRIPTSVPSPSSHPQRKQHNQHKMLSKTQQTPTRVCCSVLKWGASSPGFPSWAASTAVSTSQGGLDGLALLCALARWLWSCFCLVGWGRSCGERDPSVWQYHSIASMTQVPGNITAWPPKGSTQLGENPNSAIHMYHPQPSPFISTCGIINAQDR